MKTIAPSTLLSPLIRPDFLFDRWFRQPPLTGQTEGPGVVRAKAREGAQRRTRDALYGSTPGPSEPTRQQKRADLREEAKEAKAYARQLARKERQRLVRERQRRADERDTPFQTFPLANVMGEYSNAQGRYKRGHPNRVRVE